MKETKGILATIILLASVLITDFAQGPAMAADNAQEGQSVYRPSAIVVIQYKERDHIRTLEKRFRITAGTKITDSGGAALNLRSLPVPCEAIVEYEPYAHSDPVARKIVLRKAFPRATTKWSVPMPE